MTDWKADSTHLMFTFDLVSGQESVVDLEDDPLKEGAVQTLGQGVTSCYGLSKFKAKE